MTFAMPLVSLALQTRYVSQDCDGMDMSSDEKMTTWSSVSSKLKCMDVGISEGRGRDT